ncbi:MAG TPA: RNA polymerase subunit sigma [Gammaproteobacteria bacterium]|nr:RNA polymerase subunit sigma [Gammaproteobacteria bacterium]
MLGKAHKHLHARARSDSALMLAYRTGDAKAFELLYVRYKDSLFAYFRRNTNDEALSRELFQDVWMSVIQGRDKYQDTAPFNRWLYRIAHNRLVDHYRYVHSRSQTETLDNARVSTLAAPLQPQEIVAASEDRERLNRAIQQLPLPQRDVFVMRMQWRLGLSEIADIVGESRETIKSRLRYAGNKVRAYLRGES